jgi:NAD dependent epimerase/dehydratase family enzyme
MFGEMSEMLLSSQRVAPKGAEAAGFRFRYPQLTPALADLLK